MNAIYLIRAFELILPQYGFFTNEVEAYDYIATLEAVRRKRNPGGVTGNIYSLIPIVAATQPTIVAETCQPA